MFHPPLLRIVPMALIAVIVLSLVFVTVDGLGVFGAERLETLLIRSMRSLGNPDRMIGPPIVEESGVMPF